MYFNRELSWLKFNERVLFEGMDESLPLMERLKFLAIFSSNLDEFFMVRVASINQQISAEYSQDDISGYTPLEVYGEIRKHVLKLIKTQYEYSKECIKELGANKLNITLRKNFKPDLLKKLNKYFENEIFPVLTPMAVDFSRPFPFVRNKTLYIMTKLRVEDSYRSALIQVPVNLKRVIEFKVDNDYHYVLLEDIIMENIEKLFIGFEVESSCLFRLTRNADLEFMEDGADDLLMVIEQAIKKRQWGDVIRLEVSHNVDKWTLNELTKIYNLNDDQIYKIHGIMDQTLWFSFSPRKKNDFSRKVYQPRIMPYMKKKNIFKTLSEQDIFLHHPYESFDFVLDFIKQASRDPKVLAIKQTLYRVSGDSEIIKALGDAAEAGKQVTVLVELMARFDEENNIEWAKMLEKKGVHVVYGVYKIKTHSKITLVVRRENKRIKRYVHLGTGNYNDKTANLYTDMGYMTCRENVGSDASVFFNMVFGFNNAHNTRYLVISPNDLRNRFYELLQQEIEAVNKGREGFVIAKMNSLVDKDLIDKLYEASQAGVKIKLVVRGICSLVPGVDGLSENIQVKSIIGEFLEHSRIYYFKNDEYKMYLSSADWMTRNLSRRVELMFPILDDLISERILKTLDLYLADNTKSWCLDHKGKYHKIEAKKKEVFAHEILKSLKYDNHVDFVKKLEESM